LYAKQFKNFPHVENFRANCHLKDSVKISQFQSLYYLVLNTWKAYFEIINICYQLLVIRAQLIVEY